MKVHLIKQQTIEEYAFHNSGCRLAFENWLTALKDADWDEVNDILQTFSKADNLGNGTNRVVFNIGGNNYRMIVRYLFGRKKVHLFICWIGTHAEYTKICKQNKQYDISVY